MNTIALSDLMLRASHTQSLRLLNARGLAILTLLSASEAKGRKAPWGTLELANAIGCGKPAITRIVTNLAIRGMVENERNRKDGRLRCIRLRDRGRTELAQWTNPPEPEAIAA